MKQLALVTFLLTATACGSTQDNLAFPKGFLFGTAVAGFQVDMGCPRLDASQCEDPGSDWYQYISSPVTRASANTHLAGDPASAGPGFWELYAADLDRVATELGGNGFRLSLEWSRIFPTATDGIEGHANLKSIASQAALDRYHAMFAAMKNRGITPLVTLNHYSLPTWIHDAVGCNQDITTCSPRGWVDRERTVREIAKFAGFCAREFGAEVDLWATLNEPFTAVLLAGYVIPSAERTNPPAVWMKVDEARTVFLALVEAHARMYDAVKAADTEDADGDGKPALVGVVYPMSPVRPKDPSKPRDVQAAENVFYLWNLLYLNAVVKGDLDEDFDGTAVRREDLVGRMDYLGINYYTPIVVEGIEGPALPQLSPLTTFNPLTFQTWIDDPKGIYEMVMLAHGWGLPVYITENGVADPDDDGTAPSFLVRNLTWLSRAIRDGADVRGYFYWTLMDNYEWNHGMGIRMGLYAVDKNDPTKARVARQAVSVFHDIAAGGRIPPELTQRYPAPEK